MVCVLLSLFLLLTQTSGALPASSCPPRWLLFGDRCFAFFPVWSNWSSAESLCSQTGGHLASLHTPEERKFVRQLTNTHTATWLRGRHTHQNNFWFHDKDSTNQEQGETGGGGACMSITPKSGELHSAPCGELRFYICSTRASFFVSSNKHSDSGLVPGVSLADVVWGFSESLADSVRRSSSFVLRLVAGPAPRRCSQRFVQQEAPYLLRVGRSLEVLLSRGQEVDDVTSLLQETQKLYSSRNQSLLSAPPPPWLLVSLQSFHFLVLEDPVYLLVALSARAHLNHFLFGALQPEEDAWIRRYRKVLEAHQDHMDVFKAINVFREHMMHQKSLHRAVNCDEEDDR